MKMGRKPNPKYLRRARKHFDEWFFNFFLKGMKGCSRELARKIGCHHTHVPNLMDRLMKTEKINTKRVSKIEKRFGRQKLTLFKIPTNSDVRLQPVTPKLIKDWGKNSKVRIKQIRNPSDEWVRDLRHELGCSRSYCYKILGSGKKVLFHKDEIILRI
jgi:hypothetical protein